MDRKKITKKEEIDLRFEENIIDWCTFYRRNIHRFIEHYFGIKLHLYQVIMIYLMNLCPTVVVVCSRAVSKSFLTSLFSCAICVLYPNSKVVVTAKLKQTARLLVSEKIEKELMNMSHNLRREIAKIQSNQNHVEVVFKNGSSLLCCACNDNAKLLAF